MIKAVIDVGTNSVKLSIAEGKKGNWHVLREELEVVRLGEKLIPSMLLSVAAVERSAKAVARFVRYAEDAGGDEVCVVGTMALREAKNTPHFVRVVKSLCGADVHVLSAEEEASLSCMGVLSGMPGISRFTAFDVGGGSTEITEIAGGRVIRTVSLKTGAVRITEDYLSVIPVPSDMLSAAQKTVDAEIEGGAANFHTAPLVGIGGTVVTMAAVRYGIMAKDADRFTQGRVLTEEDIEKQIALYMSKSLADRKKIAGLDPQRADVILAGACIVKSVVRCCSAYNFIVSSRGLRHGILNHLFSM